MFNPLRVATFTLITLLGLATAFPVRAQEAPRMSVETVVTLGEQKMGDPKRTLPAGEEFNFTLGEMGKLQINIVGRAAPINERASALDYTIEMEEWTKAGSEVKRTSQTLRVDNGSAAMLGGIRDTKGRELRVQVTVSRPPAR